MASAFLQHLLSTKHVPLDQPPFTCDVIYRWANPLAVRPLSNASAHATVQRYRDNGELRFSMRSLARVKGVRNIHVVAKGPSPAWLDVTHPRIFWWNETLLLEKLRIERGITTPVMVSSSEPAKFGIYTLRHQLAERFLLVDDDYFLLSDEAPLSTNLFFNSKGIPLHSIRMVNTHRPIPLLRDAYVRAVQSETDEVVSRILTAGSNRNPHAVDRLPDWSAQMHKEGTVERILAKSVARMPYNYSVNTPSRRRATSFWLFSRYGAITANQSAAFFASVQRHKPVMMCINDNWPKTADAYLDATRPFRQFLISRFPQPEPWEVPGTELFDSSPDTFEPELDRALEKITRVGQGKAGPSKSAHTRPNPGAAGAKIVHSTRNVKSCNAFHGTSAEQCESHCVQAEACTYRDGHCRRASHFRLKRSCATSSLHARVLEKQPPPIRHVAAETPEVPRGLAHKCSSTGRVVALPSRAFDIPSSLTPLLAQLTNERRSALRNNPERLPATLLTKSIEHLDMVDVDNTISETGSLEMPRQLKVAELNAERGRYWCDFAAQILSDTRLRSVDVWMLNEFDLGMARSAQQHTVCAACTPCKTFCVLVHPGIRLPVAHLN
jgi:hypothetical protein